MGQRYVLDQLLEIPPGARVSDLERWRKGPVPRGFGPTLIKALEQVAEVAGLGMTELEADRRSGRPAGRRCWPEQAQLTCV